MKTKEPYCELDLEIIKFEAEDIITDSKGEGETPLMPPNSLDDPMPTY